MELPQDMKVNESDSSQTNKTAKQKPTVQPWKVSRTASNDNESLVSSPPPYQRSESMPRSTSPSHVYTDFNTLPRNFDVTRYQEPRSSSLCHIDFTASSPMASKRSNVKPPVPKPCSGSLNAATIAADTTAAATAAAADDIYVTLHKSLTLNSCPPKVLLL